MRRGFSHSSKHIYNALGQLIRVNDPHENAAWVYSYDRGSNITSKVKYAYTTGALGSAVETIPYTYGDSNWKDKLTAYNGKLITYDAIGNPLNDGTWSYEWVAGRQLKKMTKIDATVEFKYDHNGLRVGKLVTENGVATTTNYTLHGKLLTHMTVDYRDTSEVAHQDVLHFFYDAQSRPAKVNFNGEIYTYIHNLQGDIVGILDNAGNLVVEYKYDAWGKPIATTGSLAETLGKRNPFRYRGYVYDVETGCYDLHQRFYWAESGRFISADSDLGDAYLLFEHNLYGYCSNEPVYFSDSTGNKQTRPKPVASSGNLQRWTYMIHDDHGEPKGDGSYYWHIHLYYRGVKMYSVNETGRPHDQRNNIQMGNRARKNGLQDALDKLNERNIWPPKGRGGSESGGNQKSKKSIDRQTGSQLKQSSTASIHTMVGLMNGRTVPCILVNDPISMYAGSCAVPQGFGLNLGNALGCINDFIGGWNIFAIPEYAMN